MVQFYPQLQASLVDCLHELKFVLFLVGVLLNIVQACIRSCVGPRASAQLLIRSTTLTFRHQFTFLQHYVPILDCHILQLPTFSRCQCGHTIDNLGTHLFRCPCENERTIVHDTFQGSIVAIALENGPHIEREVSHFFPCHLQQQVDILITRDGFEL